MKKFTNAATAAALSASLLIAPPAAHAAGSSSSSSLSSQSVTANKDNADQIPADWESQDKENGGPTAPLGSAYTGSAPISIALGIAAVALIGVGIYNLPQVQQAIEDFQKNRSR